MEYLNDSSAHMPLPSFIMTNYNHRGRPAYDPIWIYVYVEAWRRKLGLSVNAFCKLKQVCGVSNCVVFLRYDREADEQDVIEGPTLRRRFAEAKKHIQETSGLPGTNALGSNIERMVVERMAMLPDA